MKGRRVRQRRQEQARYHQEQSELKPREQDLRFRLGQIRRERGVNIAVATHEFNVAVSELSKELAEKRKKIWAEADEKVATATGRAKSKVRSAKETADEAARFGIAIPSGQEILQALKSRT